MFSCMNFFCLLWFFFFNDTATTEIYTLHIVGSVRCVQETVSTQSTWDTSFWYSFIFSLLIVVFTYFYTAVTINPVQIADDLKRNGGFIPGIKPGKKTSNYIDTIMSRITLPGSLFLAMVAIMPAFAKNVACKYTIFAIFRRNFSFNYGRCYFGYITTN
eukprot:TRINITY_DN14167_c0_g1_i1.p1 TRINITY_DN14167_c0_g1~~TRINITY_DN14167_c0_g1_i1.p1  ORF type:complete len:159 (-),score=15.14 TRINITY_DN14167_c0_g1_i1:555-1031(-)